MLMRHCFFVLFCFVLFLKMQHYFFVYFNANLFQKLSKEHLDSFDFKHNWNTVHHASCTSAHICRIHGHQLESSRLVLTLRTQKRTKNGFLGLVVKACQEKFSPRAYHLPNPLRQGCNKPSGDSANQTRNATFSGFFFFFLMLRSHSAFLMKTHSLLKDHFHCPLRSERRF